MKQYAVIGVGSFGYNLAVTLSELKNEVLVIDNDKKKIDRIKDKVTLAIVADATDKEVLSEFITDSVDTVIVGLGDNMEANILTTLYLRELKVKRIIAKAMSNEHGDILKAIGANTIVYPEKDMAVKLAQELSNPNLIDHIPFAPEYSIITIAPPDRFVGKTLKELQLRNRYNIEVIAVKDVLSDTFHLIPGADFKVPPDSALLIIGMKSDIEKLNLLK